MIGKLEHGQRKPLKFEDQAKPLSLQQAIEKRCRFILLQGEMKLDCRDSASLRRIRASNRNVGKIRFLVNKLSTKRTGATEKSLQSAGLRIRLPAQLTGVLVDGPS